MLECQFRLVAYLKYTTEDDVDAEFRADGLTTLVGFVAEDEFKQ